MLAVLTLLAMVVFAHLSARYLLVHLHRKFLFVTLGEYVLLGVLIGPELPSVVSHVLHLGNTWNPIVDRQVLLQLSPLVSLAIGWAGLLYGMQFDLKKLVNDTEGAFSLASLQSLVTFFVVPAVFMGFMALPASAGLEGTDKVAFFLAATAMVSSPSVVEYVQRTFSANGRHSSLLARSTMLDEIIAILAFGLLFCLHHPSSETNTVLSPTEWFVITAMLGVLMGIVFHFFLDDKADEDSLFLALVGIIVFASGTAYYLDISPLMVNLVLGMVLVNTSRHARDLMLVIRHTHQPMVLVLMIFAGMLWNSLGWQALALSVLYLLGRAASKMMGGWLGAVSISHEIKRNVGRGLLGHGELAIAMAINFRLVYEGPLVEMAFSAVIVSVLLNEVLSVRFLKGLLIDCGEVTSDISSTEPSSPPPSTTLATTETQEI